MRVVDVRDFCIPSDENDYDELVAFADTMASIQQFEAVPMGVIDDIRAEIRKEMNSLLVWDAVKRGKYLGLSMALDIIWKHISGKENDENKGNKE